MKELTSRDMHIICRCMSFILAGIKDESILGWGFDPQELKKIMEKMGYAFVDLETEK